jgi:hypothetical protein
MKISEHGFTSIELLAALAIGMTLAGFIYASHQFSIRMIRRWEEKMGMDQIAWAGLDKMSRDLTGAQSIVAAGDSSLSIMDGGGEPVLYRFSDGCLFRNGVSLNNPPVVVYQWKAVPIAAPFPKPLPGISETADSKQAGSLVEMEWTVGNSKRTVSLRTAVFCRNIPCLKGYEP